MSFKEIKEITAVKIVKEIGTVGSSPLLVIDRLQNQYYAKTSNLNVPRVELINEIFCACALRCWDLCVPEICLIKIPYEVVEQFNSENEKKISSNKYSKKHFETTIFFGSKNLENVIEIRDYLPGISKLQFNGFLHPEDLIKIGVFDKWVGNKDRKPSNPNILITNSEGKMRFCPIDHTAAFSHLPNYQQVNEIMLINDNSFSILPSKLSRDILSFLPQKRINSLCDDIKYGMDNFIDNYDNIVDLIPSEWGFSKRSKQHLKTFFSDSDRNTKISNSYKVK